MPYRSGAPTLAVPVLDPGAPHGHTIRVLGEGEELQDDEVPAFVKAAVAADGYPGLQHYD